MSQLTLFDEIVRRCRESDPDTSRLAADHARGISGKLQHRMLTAFRNGPFTANEAAMWCVQRWGEHDRESYRKRKHELQRLGKIRFVGKTRCEYSGRIAERFEAV